MTNDKTGDHYVVQVDVKHVTHQPQPGQPPSRSRLEQAGHTERVIEDTAHLVFRAPTLTGAIGQARSHLDLMREDWADGGSLT